MKLQSRLRFFEVVVICLLSVTAMEGQAVSQNSQHSEKLGNEIAASRMDAHPFESGVSFTAGVGEPTIGSVLPLSPEPVLKTKASQSADSPSRRELRVWKSFIVVEHSAAILDAWTTRQALQSGNGYERNLLVKPFADSAAIYPMLQLAPVGFDYLGRRMLRSQNQLFRKTWWLPQLASTGASLWCASRNLRVAGLKR